MSNFAMVTTIESALEAAHSKLSRSHASHPHLGPLSEGEEGKARQSLHNKTAAVLSVIIGLDSVAHAAFVGRLTWPHLDRDRTATI